MTYPDLMLLECCERIQFITNGQLFEKYGNLKNFHVRMSGLAEIAHYMVGDKDFKTWPFNNKSAIINNIH